MLEKTGIEGRNAHERRRPRHRRDHIVRIEPALKIIVAPESSATLTATKRPCVWKTGSAWIRRSAAVNRQHSTSVRAFEERFSWLSIAPFERPVVPEV